MSRSLYLIQDNTEEHNMFRSKPTVGSVCGGICGSLPQPYERHHETLSPRLVCMKTRDIFKRMSRSLHLIQDNAEEHDMFRSKPTVGSVCGGICGGLPLRSLKKTPQTSMQINCDKSLWRIYVHATCVTTFHQKRIA